MRARTPKTVLRSILVLSSVLWASQALALHEESPPATRLTSADNHAVPPGRSWGNWLMFSSTQDLAQIGTARVPGRQLFVFNMGYFDCYNGTTKVCPPGQSQNCQTTPCPPAGTPFLRQVTNGPGDPDSPALGLAPDVDICVGGPNADALCSQDSQCPLGECSRNKPWLLHHRQWFAFDALGVFNGNTGAAATHRQIFLKNLGTGEIRQVTASTGGDSTLPSVNERGGIISFQSTAALDGFGNPAGVSQVYLFQRDTGVLRRVSIGRPPVNAVGLGPSTNASSTLDGSGVVFESTADLLGDGHDTAISQIFLARFDKRLHVVTDLFQATHGNGDSHNPFHGDSPGNIAQKVIVFDSVATDLPGTALSPGRQIYEVTLDSATGAPSPNISQITSQPIFGDCQAPRLDPTGNRLGFICTGDPLLNTTIGNRMFILDRPSTTLYQLTGAGDVQPPFSQNLGQWFAAISTTSDLTGNGVCGYQLYVIDYSPGKWAAATAIGQLPPDVLGSGLNSVIGLRTFEFLAGDATATTTGSQVAVATTDGVVTAGIVPTPTQPGRIGLNIGAPDEFTGEANITVDANRFKFPPTVVPGIGALCIEASAPGQGTIDCTGGKTGGDVDVSQDHNTDDADFYCQNGCRENAPCPTLLGGPHLSDCPRCSAAAACTGGALDGQVCDPDSECPSNGVCNDGTCPIVCTAGACTGGESCTDPDLVCQTGLVCHQDKEPTCNGRAVSTQLGVYATGGARVTIPVHVTVSLDPGPDDIYCTGDPGEQFSNLHDLDGVLRLTTGAATSTLADADNTLGTNLTATEAGGVFDCALARAGDLTGARFVATLTLLDANVLPGVRDMLVSLRLNARPGVLSSCSPTCNVATDCNDNNPCNGVEACTNGHCALGTPLDCSDNNACNGVESCDPLTGCQLPVPPDCDDNNVCTTDSCDPLLGCQHIAVAGTCDDFDACTTGDTCAAGACVGTPTVCTDNDACNGLEVCNIGTGLCDPGVPLVCGDNNVCTTDTCDATLGCVYTNNTDPCDDNNLCTDSDVCAGGVCAGVLTAAATACNAGNGTVCDGLEMCNPATGACDPGVPLVCDDNNVCTDDSCDAVLGCQHVNNTGICDDGTACTTGDTCTAGACVGVPVICDNGTVCDGLETCDAVLGCQPGTPPDCDDLNPCTDDSCDPILGCQHVNNTNPCTDGTECTVGDVCTGGLCLGVPLVCDDGDACNGAETCDAFLGCQPGTPPTCDDNNSCTDDACVSPGGCVFTNDDTNGCSDNDLCTSADACVAGVCVGSPVFCSNNDACDGVETCNPTTGLCDPGTPLTCDDNNLCTDDSCDPGTGCVNAPNANPCDDGSACTSGDTCAASACVGTPVQCDDNNACNGVETCDPALGCQIGTTLVCNDNDECTVDSCDPDVGCVNAPFPNVAVCRMIALIDFLNATDPDLLGGASAKRRLLRRANGALRATQRFYTGNPRLARNNQRRAERRLSSFVHIVQTGLIRGTIDTPTGDHILDLATQAALDLANALP